MNTDGCPNSSDSDGDGVYDSLDDCPYTPEGFLVDRKGCPLPSPPLQYKIIPPKSATLTKNNTLIFKGIRFKSGKDTFTPYAYKPLDDLTQYLFNNRNKNIEIQGHTDNTGDETYNQILSEKRANAVRMYLLKKGISPSRLSVRGYGPNRPIAKNYSKRGRLLNRRVEIKFLDRKYSRP